MKNYIVIDGKKIELSEDTVENIKKELSKKEPTTYEELMESFSNGNVYFIGISGDISHYQEGRYVLEKNDAYSEKQLESIIALNKLANVAYVLNDGWIPDWGSNEEFKYSICLSHDKLKTEWWWKDNHGCVCFKSKELAQKAIDILGEDEIRKALTLNYK